MKKWELAILTGLILSIFVIQFTSFANSCKQVTQSTLRMHILANSDSEQDQQLKIAVRDALIEKYSQSFAKATTLEESKDIARGLLYSMEYTAQSVVNEFGFDYDVEVELENIYFDTKIYDGFTMPHGTYDALRVEIGSASGQNWFCVMYPKLCIPAASSEKGVQIYSQNEVDAITTQYEVKFALLEWIDDLEA